MSAESASAVASVATRAATDVLGFELNSVRLFEPAPPRLVPVAYADAVVDIAGERQEYRRGECVHWDALDAGEPRVYQRVSDIDNARATDLSGEGSILVCPLGDRGVIALGTLEPNAIDEEDIALAEVLAANTEAALERAERERQLERKTERLDRFAGVVAHEFRNPVTIAAGHLEYVDGTPGDDPHLAAATRAVERMDRLIDCLLDMVRGGVAAGSSESVSVSAVAREVAEAVDEPGAVRCPADVTVVADPDRLRTILENVLGNAVAHAESGVTVTVGSLDDAAGFYVADDGTGFDTTDPDRLFEYGATADAEATGLGLAIVRDLAEAQGWRVSACTGDDGGARVEFYTRPDIDA
ncbi:GAF domain-containing sensor histidine kinase [Halobaculum marinum]